MNDGQGQQYGNQGLPFAVMTTAAPAGSDAEASLALAVPCQSTLSTTPIDLGGVTPTGYFSAKAGCGCDASTVKPNYVPWALVALVILLLVRK